MTRHRHIALATMVAAAAAAIPAVAPAWAQATKPAASGPAATQPSAQSSRADAQTAAKPAEKPVDPVEECIQRTKHPVSWFSWGADLRMREEYFNNAITLNKNDTGHEYNYQRYRSRLWGTLTPIENVDINARLMWEPRHNCKPETKDEWTNNEAMFDILNVTWKKIGTLPWTVVAGRQELKFGDGWMILEGTPEDGSRTIFFDAIRSTYELKEAKTTIDAVYIDQDVASDMYIEPFGDKEVPLRSQDERGVILYASNKSLDATVIDGYFIYKHDKKGDDLARINSAGVVGDNADIYTYGTRVQHDFDEHWQARGEIAEQLGHIEGHDLCAMGANTRLTYFFRDTLENQLRTGYEYLSGDDPDTDKNEQFNLVWGRWPQWSELYIFTMVRETRIADITNLHRVYWGHTFKPAPMLEMCTDYHLLFADTNPLAGSPNFSNEGVFRGQLLTALLRYKFSEHISGHLIGEAFFPGNYYTDRMNDWAAYARYELVFSW